MNGLCNDKENNTDTNFNKYKRHNPFNLFCKWNPCNGQSASKTPDVGERELEIPSPSWKASTAVCLVMPTRSANGAIMDKVSAA